MSTNRYLERPRTRIRRKDRAMDDDAWIDRFLNGAAVGHVALCWQGEPLLHSNLFWYNEGRVYWHTAGTGRFPAMAETGETKACFSVMEHGRILPAGTPLDFSTEYASVLLYGTMQLVTDSGEKRRALEGLMSKYASHLEPGKDYVPMPDSDIAQTSVYRLDVGERVAKHNIKPADYPAYNYAGESFIDEERAAGRLSLKAKELS